MYDVNAIDWRQRSACRDEDPELFFPTAKTGTTAWEYEVAEAKTVCGRCPVASKCLSWALGAGEDEGVWGGMDPEERRALRRADLVVPVVERRAA